MTETLKSKIKSKLFDVNRFSDEISKLANDGFKNRCPSVKITILTPFNDDTLIKYVNSYIKSNKSFDKITILVCEFHSDDQSANDDGLYEIVRLGIMAKYGQILGRDKDFDIEITQTEFSFKVYVYIKIEN